MRNGFLAALSVVLACTAPALAQMPYSYGGYPAYPGMYPAYGAPNGGYYGYYNNGSYGNGYYNNYYNYAQQQPQQPPVMQPPWPATGYSASGYGPGVQGSPVMGWPPPAQQLPSANPPPPSIVPQPCNDPASIAPLTDPAPGTPLACEQGACPVPPPPSEKQTAAPRGYRVYGGIEALYLWMKRDSVPPLAATGPLGPGTSVLLDSFEFDDAIRWAVRGTVGYWLNPANTVGVEASYFQIFQRSPSTTLTDSSLAVPFFNTGTGAEDAVRLAVPGVRTGSVNVEESTRLWATEIDLRGQILCGSCYHVDLLVGFQAVGLDEDIDLLDTTTAKGGGSTAISDRFSTRNLFLGGLTGLEGEAHLGRWFVDVCAKVAVGNMDQDVRINGDTVRTTAAGVSTAVPGGVFAQAGAIGHFSRDDITVVQELGIHVGYQVSHCCRLFGGYELLYLANVVRPGDQIDRGINPSLGTAGSVAFAFRETGFWVQGISCGLEFRY
jgi:hypothetical protein